MATPRSPGPPPSGHRHPCTPPRFPQGTQNVPPRPPVQNSVDTPACQGAKTRLHRVVQATLKNNNKTQTRLRSQRRLALAGRHSPAELVLCPAPRLRSSARPVPLLPSRCVPRTVPATRGRVTRARPALAEGGVGVGKGQERLPAPHPRVGGTSRSRLDRKTAPGTRVSGEPPSGGFQKAGWGLEEPKTIYFALAEKLCQAEESAVS